MNVCDQRYIVMTSKAGKIDLQINILHLPQKSLEHVVGQKTQWSGAILIVGKKKFYSNQFEAEDRPKRWDDNLKVFCHQNCPICRSWVEAAGQHDWVWTCDLSVQFVFDEIWPRYTFNRCGWPMRTRTGAKTEKQFCVMILGKIRASQKPFQTVSEYFPSI